MRSISTSWEFVQLMHSEDPEVRKTASHVTAPEAVWFEIIEDYPTFRWAVAQNKHVPIGVLYELAEDEDPRVRSMVARKRKLPSDLLERMSQDGDTGVRLAIAFHPSASEAVLRRLSTDDWTEVANKAKERLGE